MPASIDFIYLVLVTVVLMAVDRVVFFPRFKAAAMANVPGVRRRAYRRTAVAQWVLTGAALAIWIVNARSWRDLGLVPPEGPRVWVSIVLVAALGAIALRQSRAIGRLKPERRVQLRGAFRGIEYLLPHTRDEAQWFTLLSVTAGFCEELVYRGYFVWVLQPYVGRLGALGLGVAVFAFGHAYQGWRGMLKTAAAGALMSAVVLGTGWLIPAMVLHALVDLNSGWLGFVALEERPAVRTAA